jgi:hypothetical protein
MDLLHAMGWYDGMPLVTDLDQQPVLLMQGMSYKGMIAMIRLMWDALGETLAWNMFKNIYALGGQRARSDKLDGTVEEIFESLPDNVANHTWVVEQMSLMADPDCDLPYHGAFATEFELFILAFLVVFNSHCDVDDKVPADDSGLTALDKVPARTVESYSIRLYDGTVITVINAPAERRGRGDARATSKNNVKHWLTNYDVPDGTTVVITASRNGTARVLATSEAMLHSINDTITVIGFAGAPEGKPESHFVAMLSETANMVLKAAEAFLNRLLPIGAKPLTSRDVKLLLDRLVKNLTPETVSDIVNEVSLDLVARAA